MGLGRTSELGPLNGSDGSNCGGDTMVDLVAPAMAFLTSVASGDCLDR